MAVVYVALELWNIWSGRTWCQITIRSRCSHCDQAQATIYVLAPIPMDLIPSFCLLSPLPNKKKNYKIAIEQNTEETKSFFAKRPCVRKWDSPHLIIENGTVKKFTYLTKERLNSKVGSNEDYDVNS